MTQLKTEAEKHAAALIYNWLKDKPRTFQIAALGFLWELIKLEKP